MALVVNTANAPTVDETSLLQNATATAGVAGDDTDNDITVAAIDGSAGGGLPATFEARLFALMGATTPLQVSLSGYTGAVGNTGDALVSITNAYIDLAFTDAQGDPLGDVTNTNGGADWSGLYAIDGTKIFLFTDTNNNIVIGRKGNANGTSDPADDTPNSGGAIMFAGYLEETQLASSGSAKMWVAQFAPLKHGNVNDPDDAVTMAQHLWVSATADLAFDFAGLPSGQNKFLMFQATGNSNIGLVVTGMDPDKVNDKGNDIGDTVNTSQGGGPTTIGTNNQSIDPPKGSEPGEGMIFTFVNRPNPDYTVPNLTHGEAVVEGNVDYDYDPGNAIPAGDELFDAGGATFFIAQQTPPKSSTARISAFTTAFEEMTAYFDGLLDANDLANRVAIATVTVKDAAGNAVAGLDGVSDDADHTVTATDGSGITVHWNQGGAEGALGTVTIAGFQSDFQLSYTTSGTHNRVLIENVGGSNGSSPFDIGGFTLPNIVTTPEEVGTYVAFEDDAPKLVGSDSKTVDEDGLTGLSVGIAGGDGDVVVADDGDANEATNSGLLSTIFAPGNDGLGAYGVDDAGLASIKAFATEDLVNPIVLKSKGGTVLYDVIGNVLWGFVNVDGVATEYDGTDRAVFKLEITNTATGAWTFTLLDQLDHPTLDGATGDNTENDIVLHLGSVLKITDKDGDSRFGASDSLKITVDDDTPVINSISNLVGFNTGAPLTGVYDFKLGADEPGNTSVDGVILQSVAGTTSGGRAIVASDPAPSVTWQSENDTSVTYAFSFDYFIASAPSTVTNTATGTVTFNKTNGTYVFDLDNPINGSTTFSTSDVAGLITYNTGGNNSPEITVKEYTSDFVGVLYARTTDGGQGADEDMNAGGDHTFAPPEVFDSVQAAYINVSTDTLGADSDTLQPYEVLNFDFFEDNPVVPVSPSGTQDNPVSTPGAAINTSTPRAYGDTVSITLNQINISGQDDVAILLKLQKPGTSLFTTRLLLANSASDYVDVGGQNHVVTVGTDDYATEYAAGYRICGVQVLASTGQVTDGSNEAFALSNGAAVSLSSGNGTYADSSDNDVLKIVKIDVTTSQPADADLQFSGTLIDADGDSAGSFNFAVHLEGNSSVLAGGAGSDALTGTSAAETLNGGPGADWLTGGGGADLFVFAAGDSNANPLVYDTITDFATGVDQIVTSKAAGDAHVATGSTDLAGFIANANTYLAGVGAHSIYVEYDAAGTGNAWVVIDENNSDSVNAGDSVIVLTGINLNTEITAADFV